MSSITNIGGRNVIHQPIASEQPSGAQQNDQVGMSPVRPKRLEGLHPHVAKKFRSTMTDTDFPKKAGVGSGTFGTSERFSVTFESKTGLLGQTRGNVDGGGRKPGTRPRTALKRDVFANFFALQGPTGTPRKSGNMTGRQKRQIANAFSGLRSQGDGGLGLTIPVPGTPNDSVQPSRAVSPNDTRGDGE